MRLQIQVLNHHATNALTGSVCGPQIRVFLTSVEIIIKTQASEYYY